MIENQYGTKFTHEPVFWDSGHIEFHAPGIHFIALSQQNLE